MRRPIWILLLASLGVLTFYLARPAVSGWSAKVPDFQAPAGALEAGEPAPLLASGSKSGEAERKVAEPPTAQDATEVPAAAPAEPAETSGSMMPPEDPVEVGECTLLLRLEDAESGEPLAGKVQLWRLGAPGNVHWSAGDQLQATLRVEQEGTEFGQLPAGAYRTVFLDAAAGSEYPDSFLVGGSWTSHVVQVRPPRNVDTYLEMWDIHGVRLENIEVKSAGSSSRLKTPESPPWLVPRTTTGDHYLVVSGMGGSYGSRSERRWEPRQAGPNGFLLGSLRGNTRSASRMYRFYVRVGDQGVVTLSVNRLPGEGERLAGLYVSREEILQHVVQSGGLPIDPNASNLSVSSYPVLIDDQHPAITWRNASIEVQVETGSHSNPWSRKWSPIDGPLPYFRVETDE